LTASLSGAVVAELLDALLDVGQCAVVAALGGGVEVGPGEPSARQLLDRGDVDDPVVQERLEGRHVADQERAVGGHGVASERRPAALGTVLPDVRQHLSLGLTERDAGVELLQESRTLVHGADVGVHLRDGLRRRLDDQVDPLPEHVEVEVGDQGGHLDQGVRGEVETGHLAVDPHESVAHERSAYRPGAATQARSGFVQRPGLGSAG
jgi:hypothetical protein